MKRFYLSLGILCIFCLSTGILNAQDNTIKTSPASDSGYVESRPNGQDKPNPTYLAWENYPVGTMVSFIEDNKDHAKGPRLGQWQRHVKLLMKGKEGLVLRTTRFKGGVKMVPEVKTVFVENSFIGLSPEEVFMGEGQTYNVSKVKYELPDGKQVDATKSVFTDNKMKSREIEYRSDAVPGKLLKRVTTNTKGKTDVLTLSGIRIPKAEQHHGMKPGPESINAEIKKLQKLKQDLQNDYAYFMTHARALTNHEQEQLSKVAAVTSQLDEAMIALQALKKHLKDGDPLKPVIKPQPGIAPPSRLD